MRHARQPEPASRVPQAGQASNSDNARGMLMASSCRNTGSVVSASAADYHLQVPVDACREYHLVDRAGPGGRVVLRQDPGDGTRLLVMSAYRGPALPAAVANPRIESGGGHGIWRLIGDHGCITFHASAVDVIETRPALYESLHRRFTLAPRDRLALRVLLALLRLPGGARLLRRWQARRGA